MANQQIDIDGTIVYDWRHYYTPEELQERKEESIQLRNQLDKAEEEKKDYLATYRDKTKALRTKEKMARIEIKAGYEDKSERVKVVMNYAAETVEYYSISTGDMVDERKMSKKELRQGSFVHN